jgi:hypothetical protein
MTKEQIVPVRVIRFIQTVLINDIGRMINDCRLYYLSFGVIAQGIEFLGACLDELPFDEKDQAEKRFKRAIRNLFPKKYAKHNSPQAQFYLYKDFRCAMVHKVRPQNRIVLTHRVESIEEGTAHLEEYNGQLVLVAEDLYDDFKRACERVIRGIQRGRITCRKVRQDYIVVTRVSGEP